MPSLTERALVPRTVLEIGTERVDIEAPSPRISRVHRQAVSTTPGLNVEVHLLHALLMKSGVVPERDDVLQEAGAIDLRPRVTYHHASPVRLASYRAVRLEEVRAQCLRYPRAVSRQKGGSHIVGVDRDVDVVNAIALQFHGRRLKGRS